MKMNKMNYHIILLFFFSVLLLENIHSKEYKLTSEHNKRLQQAKSLRKSGLLDESINVYYQLLNDHPYLKEALDPLKSILKDQENWNKLNEILDKYQKAHNYSFQSKIETFEILLWTNNND